MEMMNSNEIRVRGTEGNYEIEVFLENGEHLFGHCDNMRNIQQCIENIIKSKKE
jgi:hypothetical protein